LAGSNNKLEALEAEEVLDVFPRTILAAIEDWVAVIDARYRIIWSNDLEVGRFSLGAEQIIGRRCHEILKKADDPCSGECQVRKVFETGKPCVSERRFVLSDRSSLWGEFRAYPAFQADGTIAYVVNIGLDITRRKENQKRRNRYIVSLERALERITRDAARKPPRQPYQISGLDLTTRELEVVQLLAQGMSNPEISRVLAISHHTVKRHVVHIFDKLGVRDRTQVAVWAARYGLTSKRD